MNATDLHARFLLIRERALAKYAAQLDSLRRRSGSVPPSEMALRRRQTRQRKAMLLLGWSFVLLSWFQGPWGSGGWFATTLGPFATKAICEQQAAWVQKTAAPRPVIPGPCVEDAR